MRTSQSETNNVPKQQKGRLEKGRLPILLMFPFLLYYAYCWGWWGRDSLLLQRLFQCNCPVLSEEWRYPKEVDVIVSACRRDHIELSPSGRFLYVRYQALTYFLDLQTMKRTGLRNQPLSSFLTDHLGFIEEGLEDHIIDLTTGKKYPIRAFRDWRGHASYTNGEPNLVSALNQAKQIFFTQRENDTVVVFMSDFQTNPEQSFTFSRSDIPSLEFINRVPLFLREHNVTHMTILEQFPHEVASPDGILMARDDGIYLAKTNQLIVKAPFGYVKGWTYDGRGAIYTSNRCLFLFSLPGLDISCLASVPQPVILLKVPEKYLSSTQTP